MRLRFLLMVTAASSLACASSDAREREAGHDATHVTAKVVDSILPVEEALRRFREGLPRVTALAGGAPSRDSLVAQFMSALESHDTSAVRQLILSRSEFAWLYYPTSVFSREPYYQMPQLSWFLNIESSQKGMARVMERFAGPELRLVGYECPARARADGGLTFWDDCVVDVEHRGASRRLRLFGSIVELDGRYKFYSYANDL